MSSLEISNTTEMSQLISAAGTTAFRDQHRALIVLRTPPDGALGTFAATHNLPFTGTVHSADRADRITEVLGCEFDILIHETRDDVDAGLLAALAGTVKAGGVLILGLPFSIDLDEPTSPVSHFNRRFAHLITTMLPQFPGKVVWLQHCPDFAITTQEATLQLINRSRHAVRRQEVSFSLHARHQATAVQEQLTLLTDACDYLDSHPQGCITITGRRGRGKSSLLGQIARWLHEQGIRFAVTAARQSALTSLHRHSSGRCDFIAPADAHRSGRQILLVDEASSLPLSLLERFLETHQHVIYCSTVEGYENTGRAFALRFSQVLKQHYAHALTLQPKAPWRWATGDPLEHLVDTLLMGGNEEVDNPSEPAPVPALLPIPLPHSSVGARSIDPETGSSLSGGGRHIRRLDRAALALDEALLQQVFSLLRDTHYQTSAADLSHLLDAPGLQLWVLEDGARVMAALMLVLEGGIDPDLHEAIVCKQRRLPHQLLPQLLAQSANKTEALAAIYGRVIRIAVASSDRRRGLGSTLLHAVESAIMTPRGQAHGLGASFASDTSSVAFWHRNSYTRFHTGFKSNPRTGKPAVAVIKSKDPALEKVVRRAVTIHDDNSRWLDNVSGEPGSRRLDTELLQKFVKGQRSVHDTFAALSRLAQQHPLPLQQDPATPRRQYEAVLREAVKSVLQ